MKQKLLSTMFAVTCISTLSFAQTREVSGLVTAADGTPISGASISIIGSNTATQTDGSGRFRIQASSGSTLSVSYIGYTTQRVSIGNSTNLSIVLQGGDRALDEVVVTGYAVQSRKEFTGASARVKGEALAERPLQSFSQGLTGQAAGVNIVQPNGLLNNPPVVRVRGLSSLSLSSFPLVVIDGIPVTTGDVSENAAANNPLADINPSDIESIDILKDAASAAIYGSRAAAGVLVITTKKGKQGSAKLSYNNWFGSTSAVRLPDVLNAQQYMDHKNQAIKNALEVSPTLPAASYPADGAFFPSYDENGNLIDTDWYDLIYRNAFSQNHDINLSGGSEKTVYYFSAGLSNQDGFLKKNSFDRKSGRFNVSHTATDWLKFNSSVSFTNSVNNAPNSGSYVGGAFASSGLGRLAIAQVPNVPAYNPDGSYYLAGGAIGSGANKLPASFANPMPLIDLDKNKSETNRLLATVGGELKIVDGLFFNTSLTWDLRNTDNNRFWNPKQGDGFGTNGHAYNNSAKSNNWNFINTLRFQKSFDDHNLMLLVGSDAQNRRTENWGGQRQDIADDFFSQYQGTFLINNAGGNGISEIAYEAYLGSASYNYAGKYFISANIRRDGNSALSSNNRWGTFGGASLGWTVSEEDFFKNSSISETISSLRLKGSWGKVGNGNLGNFYGAYNTYGASIYGTSTSFVYTQAGNNELKWETSSQTNIGLDVGLIENRLSAEINYYNKNIDNLILGVPQAPSKGIPSNVILMNVGSMYNRGWEFTVNALPVSNDKFKWQTSLNFSTNKNMVTSLVEDDKPILSYTSDLELTNITQVGYSAAQIYAVKSDGVNPENGRRIFINKAGERVQYLHHGGTNAWTYLDGTRASSVASDAQALGNTLPTWFGGFNNTFSYMNFDALLNFTYSGGNYIYNGSKAGLRDQRVWNNSVEVLDAWTPTNTNSNIPRAIYGDNVSNGSSFAISENIEKGDFLRLQTLSIGYKLPKSIFERAGISTLRVYGAVNNAFIITKYTGVDPEISTNGNSNLGSGIERNSIPNGRTFTLGLNVEF
ncbi:MAG: SusC/RagA family TonB-linked outer membrane protein [Sphingobacterium composti]